ncbi:MAG: CDP-alcohol phosphatidyltransferase family protein [Elusimicrobia bacterium]|nr:CDP-alcohol phosphatidyltransferase family protein [Elusimicrobiota bacterium]
MTTARDAVLTIEAALAGSGLAGMTLLERHLFLLSRAGIERVFVACPKPEGAARLPEGLDVRWNAEPEAPASALRVAGSRLYRQDVLAAAVQGRAALEDARRGADFIAVDGPADAGPALAWLLKGVRKDSDGFMARVFDRNISLFITRLLLETPVRPNHMTLVSTFVGLFGAAQFFYAERRHELAGSLLIWLHTVLDGCDGEMARLKHMESRWGALLDFWGDNVVHVALFAGLAFDLRRSEPMALVLGALAVAGTLGSAFGSAWLSAHNRTLARMESSNPILSGVGQLPTSGSRVNERLRRLEVALAQRDFIYILVACSILNHEEAFLWAAGLGTPLYLMIMIYIYRASRGETQVLPRASEKRLVAANAPN